MPGIDANPVSDQPDIESEVFVNKSESEKSSTEEVEEEKPKEEEEEKEEEWIDILGSGELKMKVLHKGEPHTRPEPSGIANVKLTGRLKESGTVVEEFSSLRVQVGESDVIQGLDLVFTLLDVGDRVLVEIGPRFAYSSFGLEPDIPPNATLLYEVEMLKVDDDPDLEKMSYERRKSLASAKRNRGNWWYSRQNPEKAVQCYKRALEFLDDNILFVGEDEKPTELPEDTLREFQEQHIILYNNLAAAQIHIESYESALVSVNQVLRREPKNVKALFRKGKILSTKGEVVDALELLKEAFVLEPENVAIKKELQSCLKKKQKDQDHEKRLYKKMLGAKAKEVPQTKPEERPTGGSWMKRIASVATASVVVAVAVGLGYKAKSYGLL